MSTPLEESIVLISSKLEKRANVIGTGFAFYREQNYTYLLTCTHIVEDVGGEQNVLVNEINDISAEVLATGNIKGFDLAVLRVKNLNIPPLQLIHLSEAENREFRIAGYYLYGEEKKRRLKIVKGVLGQESFLIQSNEKTIVWDLLMSSGDRLRKGYSGAPVVDLSDHVLGIATNMEKDGVEGLAISVEALNKIWIQTPLAISQQLQLKSQSLVELKSDVGYDYTKLKRLLSEGKWKEADKETAPCMLQVAGKEEEVCLREEDIDKFPCTDLCTIDQLWVKYSDGKFGVSVQKKIYQNLGGTREHNEKVWEAFGNEVGWRQGGKWLYSSDLTFSLDTHYIGHLRVFYVCFFLGLASCCVWEGNLFSRAETCRL